MASAPSVLGKSSNGPWRALAPAKHGVGTKGLGTKGPGGQAARAVPCASFHVAPEGRCQARPSRPVSTYWAHQPRRSGARPPERIEVLLQTQPAGMQGAAADRAITVRAALQTEP